MRTYIRSPGIETLFGAFKLSKYSFTAWSTLLLLPYLGELEALTGTNRTYLESCNHLRTVQVRYHNQEGLDIFVRRLEGRHCYFASRSAAVKPRSVATAGSCLGEPSFDRT